MQKVFITGGNKGIGLEITKLFVENNYHVIVVSRTVSHLPDHLQKKVQHIPFDLKNVSEISQLVTEVGDIDILINNAGIMNSLPFDAYSEDKREAIMKINLEAPIRLITEFSKAMVAKGHGRIVGLASIAGEIGHPDIWYGITKAGIINSTKSFAKILGPKGIIINCVAPSPVKTDMYDVIPEERKASVLANTATKRPAEPQEVAKAVYWLATDAPEYINGICLDINDTVYLR